MRIYSIPGNPGRPQAIIDGIMAPYNENAEIERYTTEDNETYWRNPKGKWDFFMIGGRWTGLFDGYDPETDPANIETCWLCGGTGKRLDMEVYDGCNGCQGAGKRIKWPTEWGFHPGDIVSAKWLKENFDEERMRPFFFVGLDGVWHEKETWDGEHFRANEGFDLNFQSSFLWSLPDDCYLAIVDIHN